MVVVRDGRVVHHELDAALEAKGVRVCGIATCNDDEVREHLGSATSETEDAFTVLHDAFLAGGALVSVPAGVVVPDPIVVLHWSEGDGEASFPHTLVVAGADSEVTVLERSGSPETSHLVVARGRAHRRRRGAGRLPLGAAARLEDVERRDPTGPRRCRRIVALGRDRARRRVRAAAQRVAARRARRREQPARGVLRRRRADARLPHPAGSRRAVHAEQPAVQGRGRGLTPVRCTRA